MARVTVEDCVEQIPDRFELVMMAAQRARKIGSGAALTLERDNDKNPVVALREIAEETVQVEDLREELIKNHQRVIEMDDSEDVIENMEGEEEWSALVAESAGAPIGSDDEEADEFGSSLGDMAGTSFDEDKE